VHGQLGRDLRGPDLTLGRGLLHDRLPGRVHGARSRATQVVADPGQDEHQVLDLVVVYLKADLPTLLRRPAVRNELDGPNCVTVSAELLNRYAAGFEEPFGEGERVITVT
jgi:hypothetical protein